MGEIAQVLQDKAGLSADQAQQAETIVIDLVKSKVPAEFQGMLGSVLGEDGGAAASGGLGGMLGAAEGLFGGK